MEDAVVMADNDVSYLIPLKLQTDKWQDQNGNDRYTTKIIVNEMKMLDSKGNKQGSQQPQQPARQQAPQQQTQPQYDNVPDDWSDQEIPF